MEIIRVDTRRDFSEKKSLGNSKPQINADARRFNTTCRRKYLCIQCLSFALFAVKKFMHRKGSNKNPGARQLRAGSIIFLENLQRIKRKRYEHIEMQGY
jgi:hypothetical protein